MLIGQMSLPKISEKANYLQLDICGLSVKDSINRYLNYNTNLPVILHGDWTKNKSTENNLIDRKYEYIEIINKLKEITTVYGITIHPPSRKTMSLDDLINEIYFIKDNTDINVLVENRSNKKMLLSNIDEIIDFSQKHLMTLDIPQLFISCGYSEYMLIDALKSININNIKEIHLANVLKKEKYTFVARKLDDGNLDIKNILSYLNPNAYYTLEILGGTLTFETQLKLLNNLIENIKRID